MEDILVGILWMLLIVALVPLYLWKRRQNSQTPREHEDEAQVERKEAVVRATGTRRMRRKPASSAASTSSASATIDEIVDGTDDEAAGDGYYTVESSKKRKRSVKSGKNKDRLTYRTKKLPFGRSRQNKAAMMKRGGGRRRSVKLKSMHWKKKPKLDKPKRKKLLH